MYAFNPRAHPRIKRLSACLPTYLPAGWLVPHPSPMHNAHTCTRGVPTNMDNTACELLNHHLETESNMPKSRASTAEGGEKKKKKKGREKWLSFRSLHNRYLCSRPLDGEHEGGKTAGYLLCVARNPPWDTMHTLQCCAHPS